MGLMHERLIHQQQCVHVQQQRKIYISLISVLMEMQFSNYNLMLHTDVFSSGTCRQTVSRIYHPRRTSPGETRIQNTD